MKKMEISRFADRYKLYNINIMHVIISLFLLCNEIRKKIILMYFRYKKNLLSQLLHNIKSTSLMYIHH